jgi:hypothetical protein
MAKKTKFDREQALRVSQSSDGKLRTSSPSDRSYCESDDVVGRGRNYRPQTF